MKMKKVVIMMSTYNGEEYLEEQLESLLNLDSNDLEIDIKIRDDGSTDNTKLILEKYSNENKNISWYQGENKKPAYSFFELLLNQKDYDYYAFCDQDDVWEKQKVTEAIKILKQFEEQPAIYFSAVNVVDKDLKFISKLEFKMNFTLETSFIQNPVIGCTMVLNNNLKEIVTSIETKGEIEMHDSWIYRVAHCTNSEIIYDSNSYIKYRQHGNNVVGLNNNKKFLKRVYIFLSRKKRKIGNVAKNILENCKQYLDEDKKQSLQQLVNLAENHNLKNKIKILSNKNFKSTNIKQNIKFKYDVLFNKI